MDFTLKVESIQAILIKVNNFIKCCHCERSEVLMLEGYNIITS